MRQCKHYIRNLGSWRSQYCSLENVIKTFTVMAENSENCQVHTDSTIDPPAVNLVAEARDDTKQEPDGTRQKPDDGAKTKTKKPKANYFVGIKVCNKEIIDKAEKVQQQMVNKHNALEGALISLPTLHLTLAVMHLNDQDEDEKKKSSEAMEHCLKECGPGLKCAPLILTFEGVGHFPSGVVFSKVKEGDDLNRLTELARQTRESFVSHGISLHDERFTPHLTLLKTSKLHYRRKKIMDVKKTIRAELYEEYKDLLFGTEEVVSLQLLSMNNEKDENGYYSCLKSVSFGQES